jgi:hypothetical protein
MCIISNFVLDINNNVMKKSGLVFLVAILVVVSTILWIAKSGALAGIDVLQIGVIAILVILAVVFGYRRLTSERRGEPTEDELSKKVMMKASAWAYFISLYMWVFMIWLKDRVTFDTEQLLGTGILAMAVIWALCWLVVYWRGIRDE